MSTRSIIVITGAGSYDRPQTIRLYKHCDGYPTGVLPIIEKSLHECITETKRDPFYLNQEKPLNPEHMTAKIIGNSSGPYGFGAKIDNDDGQGIYGEAPLPEHFGNQWDLEWIYLVDLNEMTLKIYGGGYSDASPQTKVSRGTVDPMKYAEQLKEECQAEEKFKTKDNVRLIEAWGMKVNPKQKKKRGVVSDSSKKAG